MGASLRQKVMVLWLADSALDSPVVAWSEWDGTGETSHMAGDASEPPYSSGLAALRDGWRLLQASPLLPHAPGTEAQTSYLKYEFWFEQLAEAPEPQADVGSDGGARAVAAKQRGVPA